MYPFFQKHIILLGGSCLQRYEHVYEGDTSTSNNCYRGEDEPVKAQTEKYISDPALSPRVHFI